MFVTEKEIRDEAIRRVMWNVGNTKNSITEYIADAVTNQVIRDENRECGWMSHSQ